MLIIAISTLIAYTIYTFTSSNLPENHSMALTVPLVTYGISRYVYLVRFKNVGEDPENIFIKDGPLLLSVVIWLITASAILTFSSIQ